MCECVCVCVCVYTHTHTYMTNIAMMSMPNILRSRGAQISSLGFHEMKLTISSCPEVTLVVYLNKKVEI